MDLYAELNKQKTQGLYRNRKVIDSAQGVCVKTNNQTLINFSSNDYLGLANDARIIKAFKKAANIYGIGAGASQLVCGYQRPHQELEEALAKFCGRERVLLFGCGYLANLGVQQALLDQNSTLFLDRLCHASIIDAARLSGARIKRYQHVLVSSLTAMIANCKDHKKMIVSDSVFSMDGDIADICSLQTLAEKYNSLWMIDDAHGFGVLGKQGRGVFDETGNEGYQPDIYLATFGKALGTYGAFVAADEALIETMIQKSRSLIYTTAPPAAIAAATLEALKIMEEEGWRREKLFKHVKYFRSCVREVGLPIGDSNTAIQTIVVGENDKAVGLSENLFEQGILAVAIRPPTVPKNTARIRITLSALHTEQQINFLIDNLTKYVAA